MNKFSIAKKQTAIFCIYKHAKEYKGLKRVTGYVQKDVHEITGKVPEIYEMESKHLPKGNEFEGRNLIVVGTIGENPYIDQKIAENKVNVREIEGKRECFRMLTITDQEEAKGSKLLIIVGSDKRGTFYGLLYLSELMGITPWGYWADVKPQPCDTIELSYDKLSFVSKEPSIKLRGFFLNDEWPSLGNFVSQAFGGFNELFYEKVFELLLRLKGNYLWPAMWSASFSLDGKENELANAILADELGVVMGTSHHEPLMRAGEEFDKFKTDSNEIGYGKDWNYYTNARGLEQFWDDSVKRNQPFENLITMGMRGERDSKILDENCGLKENIDLLKDVILAQKRILHKNGMEQNPQVLALYKEVEDYYYGDERSEGLNQWKELDPVMLLLSDDNFGNTRTLPSKENWNRNGGWGLYYHFDYHGGPVSYEWINSTPITKVWEQMTMAYEYGIRDLWVVNVGDLRPQELPLSYFMSLAYDFEQYGSKAINQTGTYLKQWVQQIFAPWVENKTCRQIEELLNGYTRMNGNRRPEVVYSDTFSILHEKEAIRELNRAKELETLAKEVEKKIPAMMKDAFFGLVYFPTMATANLRKMQIYAGLNHYFVEQNCAIATMFHKLTKDCIASDQELVRAYNEEMAGGKWKGMMSSNHVGFSHWNDEDWAYPETKELNGSSSQDVILFVEGTKDGCLQGEIQLPTYTSTEQESYDVLLYRKSKNPVSIHKEPWILVKENVINEETVQLKISIDWNLCKTEKGQIILEVDDRSFVIHIHAEQIVIPEGCGQNVFVEGKEIISMEAAHYYGKSEPGDKIQDARLEVLEWNQIQKFLKPLEFVDSGYCYPEWKVIENYGRGESAVKLFPSTYECNDVESAPFLKYCFYITHSGEYTMSVHLAPSNNLDKMKGLRIAYSMDEGKFEIIDTLPKDYAAGEGSDRVWSKSVLDNVRLSTMRYDLAPGLHTLKIVSVDPGLVIQKIELYKKPSNTYYGYQETYHN